MATFHCRQLSVCQRRCLRTRSSVPHLQCVCVHARPRRIQAPLLLAHSLALPGQPCLIIAVIAVIVTITSRIAAVILVHVPHVIGIISFNAARSPPQALEHLAMHKRMCTKCLAPGSAARSSGSGGGSSCATTARHRAGAAAATIVLRIATAVALLVAASSLCNTHVGRSCRAWRCILLWACLGSLQGMQLCLHLHAGSAQCSARGKCKLDEKHHKYQMMN